MGEPVVSIAPDGPGTIHGVLSAQGALTAVDRVYYTEVN